MSIVFHKITETAISSPVVQDRRTMLHPIKQHAGTEEIVLTFRSGQLITQLFSVECKSTEIYHFSTGNHTYWNQNTEVAN